jgi:phenylalanyl-tRNA synthetase beta chain
MTGREILSQHKAGRAYGYLLENLPRYPYFIDAKGQILSMPPNINSDTTGRVTPATQNVFIECSGFDFTTLSTCLNIIVTALADMGGEIYSLTLQYDKRKETTPNLTPGTMKLDINYVNKRLGLNLSEKQAVRLLARMGYGYEKGNVLIPAYRADILHHIDLVEDIAIAYGYENFDEIIPNVATVGEEDALAKFFRKCREIVIGLGLLEVKNYHLMTEEELNKKMNRHEHGITLKNALGDHNCLRNAVLPSLMKNLSENQHHEYPQNLFEIGRTFTADKKSETGISEREHLAVVICHERADFTEIRQVLDALCSALGLPCSVRECTHPSFIEGRVGEILIRRQKIGIIGELHPQVLTNWNIPLPVVGLELDGEKVKNLMSS